jgi:Uma2 family endonuclease
MTARPVPPLPPEARLTAEEFLTLPEGDRKLELHYGRVVDVSPASHRHSRVQKRVLPLEQLRATVSHHEIEDAAGRVTVDEDVRPALRTRPWTRLRLKLEHWSSPAAGPVPHS